MAARPDLTKPSTLHLIELLCHCGGDDTGHRLDALTCTSTVRPGNYERYTIDEVVSAAEPSFVRDARAALAATLRCTADRTETAAQERARRLRGEHVAPRCGRPLGKTLTAQRYQLCGPHARSYS